MPRFKIEIRELRECDLEQSGTRDFANTIDGGAALLINDKLVAVFNEYGTAFANDTDLYNDEFDPKDTCESFSALAMELHGAYLSNRPVRCKHCEHEIKRRASGVRWWSEEDGDRCVEAGGPHEPADDLPPESCDSCGEPFGENDERTHKHCH